MSEKQAPVYVVLRQSGHVFDLTPRIGDSAPVTYLGVLEKVAVEGQSAGSTYDRPWTLYRDGERVVDGDLSGLAWKWRRDLSAAMAAARDAVSNMHTPAWAKGDAPGYNPPGFDDWTVTKVKS